MQRLRSLPSMRYGYHKPGSNLNTEHVLPKVVPELSQLWALSTLAVASKLLKKKKNTKIKLDFSDSQKKLSKFINCWLILLQLFSSFPFYIVGLPGIISIMVGSTIAMALLTSLEYVESCQKSTLKDRCYATEHLPARAVHTKQVCFLVFIWGHTMQCQAQCTEAEVIDRLESCLPCILGFELSFPYSIPHQIKE